MLWCYCSFCCFDYFEWCFKCCLVVVCFVVDLDCGLIVCFALLWMEFERCSDFCYLGIAVLLVSLCCATGVFLVFAIDLSLVASFG